MASVLQLLGSFDTHAEGGTDNFTADSDLPYDEGLGASYSVISNISVTRQNGQHPYEHHTIEEECSADYTVNMPTHSTSQPPSPNRRPIIAASVGSLRSPFNPSVNDNRGDREMGTPSGGRAVDGDMNLSVSERQVVAIARRYAVLREVRKCAMIFIFGMMWSAIVNVSILLSSSSLFLLTVKGTIIAFNVVFPVLAGRVVERDI